MATNILRLLVAIVMTFNTQPIQCRSAKSLNGRKVVLMSMDGFRYDYLTKADTPNFDTLIASGVRVPYVNNIFATLTFPSHYTIATGLYEESHGIVGNKMYDPVFNASFRMGNIENRWWDGAEPIWINAVKSGLKVGTYFWPGTETDFGGHQPTEFKNYNWKIPFEERIDTLVDDWLAKDNFDFGIIYFNEPDHSGHKYGPDAPEMIPVIQKMDTLLGYFMKKLDDANLKEKVDFIITSDHGMTDIDQTNKLIAINDYVNSTLLYDVIGGGAFAGLRPQPGKAQDLVDALSGIEHITAYLKDDIPEQYHHKDHRRIQPVLVVAEEGWEVRETSQSSGLKGNHGFRNDYINMRPIFIASGPSFKKGVTMDPIKSVDIYPLLCHLLNLSPAPNNGSFQNVIDFLRTDDGPNAAISNVVSLTFGMCCTIFSLIQYNFH